MLAARLDLRDHRKDRLSFKLGEAPARLPWPEFLQAHPLGGIRGDLSVSSCPTKHGLEACQIGVLHGPWRDRATVPLIGGRQPMVLEPNHIDTTHTTNDDKAKEVGKRRHRPTVALIGAW